MRNRKPTQKSDHAGQPVVAHWLANGAGVDLTTRGASPEASKEFSAILGGGRGCQLRTDYAASAIWIPLRGRMQVDGGGDGLLHAGEARVTEADAHALAVGRGNSLWVALIGRPAAWRHAMRARLGIPLVDASLIPSRYAADFDLRRRAVGLARAVVTGERIETAADNVLEGILILQAKLAEAIGRCPGRTYAQRRQVFVRLQRVRNYLTANCQEDIENGELSRLASYSPTHFIRAFGAVYGETPHAFLVRQRLDRASRLLRASMLTVNEIATESGFGNVSAFSRSFRQRFGMAPGAARRQRERLSAAAG